MDGLSQKVDWLRRSTLRGKLGGGLGNGRREGEGEGEVSKKGMG